MGNRGGRIHQNDVQVLHPTKRWASRQWISCVTEFKGRQRTLMTPNQYTELFFLDEVTALAAGHRPCFECRRSDATAFAESWKTAFGGAKRPLVAEMDRALHTERLEGRAKRTHRVDFAELPAGAVVRTSDAFIAKTDKAALAWSFDGYRPAEMIAGEVDCLTPPAILAVLKAGYAPTWHHSAGRA